MAQSPLITGIEIGSSKICVMIGRANAQGVMNVLGIGERQYAAVNSMKNLLAQQIVCKGEITKMECIYPLLEEAVNAAEIAAGESIDRRHLFLAVTGHHIRSMKSSGVTNILSPDRTISQADIERACSNANKVSISNALEVIGSYDSYYLLDNDQRRVATPINIVATKLEAVLHCIVGDHNALQTSLNALHQLGYDQNAQIVFSPVASVFGVLSEQQKKDGALYIDIGAGVTEYLAAKDECILASGVIPVGLNHFANDLHVAFGIPFDDALKLILADNLFTASPARILTIKQRGPQRTERDIPLHSIEKVLDNRIRELLVLLQERLKDELGVSLIREEIILGGGGALLPYMKQFIASVFNVPIQIAVPDGQMPPPYRSPRYATVFGLLIYGDWFYRLNAGNNARPGMLDYIDDKVKTIFGNLTRRSL